MTSTNLIPRGRLKFIPKSLRLSHEYCYFLHDQCVHFLLEYTQNKAHHVNFGFINEDEVKIFERISSQHDVIEALNAIGRTNEARRVIINTITAAMTSDCLHHIFEGLRCFEKRKFIVAFNILRKPLIDNLTYLSWILGNEDEFFNSFSSGDSKALSQKIIGNRREKIISDALLKTEISNFINPNIIISSIFDSNSSSGLYGLFQHSVHLVTTERPELKTSPENFNFIFKNHTEDDIYFAAYQNLPYLFLYLSHVILELFNRIQPMDEGAREAFYARSVLGLNLLNKSTQNTAVQIIKETLKDQINCAMCKNAILISNYNAIKIILTESFRCGKCRYKNNFPFSYLF